MQYYWMPSIWKEEFVQGDSGSGLYLKRRDGGFDLLGISSFNSGDSAGSVHSNVAKHD